MACNITPALGVIAALALTLTACSGSDDAADLDTEADSVEQVQEAAEDGAETENTEDADVPDGEQPAASVEVPANWDPGIPTDPIDAMTLTFAEVRGQPDFTVYELQYDGVGQDGEALFDAYKALVLAAGWTEADQATPLVGSFSMDDRTLVITTFGGDTSQIIVSATPN